MGSLYPLSQETLETIDQYSRDLRLEVDRLLNLTYYPVAIASSLFFVFIYKVISPRISHSLFPRYRSLNETDTIEWNSRVVSNVHSLIVTAVCIHELLFDVGIRKNPIWCESCLVRTNCAVVVGYLMADLFIMILNWSNIGGLFFAIHHCVTIYAYYYVMTYGVLPWFANFRLLAELSTPFVNQRWFFDVLGLKCTKGYAINGFMLFTSFFSVRIFTMPIYYFKLYSIYNFSAFQALGVLRHAALIICLILDLINIHWFSKIFRGVKKLFEASRSQSKEKQNETSVRSMSPLIGTSLRRRSGKSASPTPR